MDKYCALANIPRSSLQPAKTPFLDEDALRKRYQIGPGGFKDQAPATAKPPKAKPSVLNPEVPLTAEHEGQIPHGKLKPIAARILMKKLYGARYARPDLLRAISALARKTTKWRPMQDAQLHRLVCYVKSTLHYRHVGWVGDSREDLVLNLFSDADLASDPEDSVSTTGVYFEVAGPNTCMPLFSLSQK